MGPSNKLSSKQNKLALSQHGKQPALTLHWSLEEGKLDPAAAVVIAALRWVGG